MNPYIILDLTLYVVPHIKLYMELHMGLYLEQDKNPIYESPYVSPCMVPYMESDIELNMKSYIG